MRPSNRVLLSLNMAFSGAALGCWQPVLVAHMRQLGFGEFQLAAALSAFPIATMCTPLAGQAADRWVSTERLISGLAFSGGLLLLAVSQAASFPAVTGLLFGALLLSAPLFSLATSLAFHHLEDPGREFPFVRAWGTVGHVAGSNLLSLWMHLSGRGWGDALALAGLVCLAHAVFAFALPHTPPSRSSRGGSATGKALVMLRTPSFAVLTACLFVLIVFGTFYYARGPLYLVDAGVRPENLAAFLSLGQGMEIFVVFALGRLYGALGAKGTLLLGLGAWVLRFGLLAAGGTAALVAAVALHGISFACWRIAATMYADRTAEPDARASVQSLLGLTADGPGSLMGNFLVGQVMVWGTGPAGPDWALIWTVPTAGCALVMLVFAAAFRPKLRA